MFKQTYSQKLAELTEKEATVRDLIQRMRACAKAGRPYYVSREEVKKVNDARTAWLEFLKVARR